MKTTQELHIALDILLQKVSSNWNKNFLPQEKDFFINREILKFVKQRFNPRSNNKQSGAFDTKKRVQDTSVLYKTVPLQVINQNQEEAVVKLPFDFLFDISGEVKVSLLCDSTNLNTILKNTYYASIDTLKVINSVTEVVLNITIGSTVTQLFKLSELPNEYLPQDGIEDYRKVFIYNNALFLKAKSNLPKDVEIYYNNDTNQIDFRSSVLFTLSYAVNTTSKEIQYSIEGNTVFVNTNLKTATLRIVDEEFRTPVKKSYLSSSKDESIVGYIRDSEILLPTIKNVVIDKILLTYVCKPKVIDLLLGINSNLSDSTLDEVISNTAETIKAVIASDTYDKFKQDNLLIE